MFETSYDIIWQLFDDTQQILIASMWLVWPMFELAVALVIIVWLLRNILKSAKFF